MIIGNSDVLIYDWPIKSNILIR